MNAAEKDSERFKKALGKEMEPVMLVIRSHLYLENLVERLILLWLPRGDKLIEDGNLNFNQKLILIESFDNLPNDIISSLRNVNKLRNQCAHQLDKIITDSDITRVGSSLGKKFTEIKKSELDEVKLLRSVLDYLCGFLTGICISLEET